MADQKRWFKVWESSSSDPSLDNLANDQYGIYIKLGAFIAVHGVNGSITLEPPQRSLCARLQVENWEALVGTVRCLPHVIISGQNSGHGEVTVTYTNWYKYQVDTTHAERKRRARSKRRGDLDLKILDLSTNKGRVWEGTTPSPATTQRAPRGPCPECSDILGALNEATGRSFRLAGQIPGMIHARHTAYSKEDCLKVVKIMVSKWRGDPKMEPFLRPVTLFNQTKFDSYLNQAATVRLYPAPEAEISGDDEG